jgi:two-component system response regulator (stage 0 sporulation protein F)
VARILIIDDQDSLRAMLRLVLERANYDVEEARNGQEGLQSLETATYDLIITDILMPGVKGPEVITELRHKAPAGKIIAMSGGGQTGNVNLLDLAAELGACRVLRKPFDLHELLAIVKEELGEKA